jgi:septation ring formation regulator EzrA
MKIEELEEQFKGLHKLVDLIAKDVEKSKDANQKHCEDFNKLKDNLEGCFNDHGNKVDFCKKDMDDKVQKAVKGFDRLENKLLDVIHKENLANEQAFFAVQSCMLRLCNLIAKLDWPEDLQKEVEALHYQIDNMDK